MTEGLKLLKEFVTRTRTRLYEIGPEGVVTPSLVGMLNVMFDCVAENLDVTEKRLDNLEELVAQLVSDRENA